MLVRGNRGEAAVEGAVGVRSIVAVGHVEEAVVQDGLVLERGHDAAGPLRCPCVGVNLALSNSQRSSNCF